MPRSHASALPDSFVAPMQALAARSIPKGNWHGEIKFDGYRAIAILERKAVQLWSRNLHRLVYPEIEHELRRLKAKNAVIDGEVVALDAAGRTRFQLLQALDRGERPALRFYVFDLLRLDGESLLSEPFEVRRARLERLVGRGTARIKLSPRFDVKPATLWAESRRLGLEGIILKQAGSLYEPGLRSGTWLKLKNVNEQEFVIGGFSPPRRSRSHFGSIAVGYYEGKNLRYAGKVGAGFSHRQLEELHARFLRGKVGRCPFADLPHERTARFGQGMTRAAMRQMTWIRPELVAQVRFAEWTTDGLLRQPVFIGLRADKNANEVIRERARTRRAVQAARG